MNTLEYAALRQHFIAGWGQKPTAIRMALTRREVRHYFLRFAFEIYPFNLTAELLGDPAPHRSALYGWKPWEPIYDDKPKFMD